MQHWWMAQQVAEEHRRDLAQLRPIRNPMGRQTNRPHGGPGGGPRPLRPDPGPPERGRTPRRAIAPSVGALLIRMGTRLGGTSMRTS